MPSASLESEAKPPVYVLFLTAFDLEHLSWAGATESLKGSTFQGKLSSLYFKP